MSDLHQIWSVSMIAFSYNWWIIYKQLFSGNSNSVDIYVWWNSIPDNTIDSNFSTVASAKFGSNGFRWISLDSTNGKATVVHMMSGNKPLLMNYDSAMSTYGITRPRWVMGFHFLTTLVPWPEYSERTRCIPCLLMFLVPSPVHQQPCHKQGKIDGSLASLGKNLKHLCHLC